MLNLKVILFSICLLGTLSAVSQQKNEQYIGTKESLIRVRNNLVTDSSLILPSDTLKSAPLNSFASVGGYLFLKTSKGWKQAIDSVNSKILHVAYNPANLTKQIGQTATFGVVASGGKAPYKYQWQKSTTNRTADTLASMVILTTALSDTGNFRVRVTDSLGVFVFSQYANLSIISASGGSGGGTTTGQLSADSVNDGTTKKAFLATERTKLSGIATGATANSPDATLLARANHTGVQAESTVTNLVSDLAAKAPIADPVFTGTPKIGADTVASRAYARSVSGGGGGGGSAILYGTTGANTDGAMTQGATTTALALKQDASTAVTLAGTQTLTNKTLTSPAITTPTGIVKGDVALGNVDNTSDVNKPVSTAQAAVNALKANLASPVFTGVPKISSDTVATLANVRTILGAPTVVASANTTGYIPLFTKVGADSLFIKDFGITAGPGASISIDTVGGRKVGIQISAAAVPQYVYFSLVNSSLSISTSNGLDQRFMYYGSIASTITLPSGSTGSGMSITINNAGSVTLGIGAYYTDPSTSVTTLASGKWITINLFVDNKWYVTSHN